MLPLMNRQLKPTTEETLESNEETTDTRQESESCI